MKRLLLVSIISLYFVNCVPAMIAGGVAATATSKRTKSKWTGEFNQMNTDREVHHLKPLDWCDEAFKVNKAWATDDKLCKQKLKDEGKI